MNYLLSYTYYGKMAAAARAQAALFVVAAESPEMGQLREIRTCCKQTCVASKAMKKTH